MFTGIVQSMGRIAATHPRQGGIRLQVDAGAWRPAQREFALGESICVSGVCLTLVESAGGLMSFDVITETLAKTMLGERRPGDAVNLEASLTPITPMGGHFMQGHVDGVGKVTRVRNDGTEYRLTVRPPAGLMEYMTPKGSVALDGVSLTIASLNADEFDVALIPTTLELTTLSRLRESDGINIEADMIAKTIVHWLRQRETTGGLTMEKLRCAGWEA